MKIANRYICLGLLLGSTLIHAHAANRTGLDGTFDFDLQWTSGPVAPAPGANPPADDGPSIFAALQEQLGLRLESGRDTFDVVVVDAVRRPTPD